VLYGQWVFHGVRAEHDMARKLAEELLRRAQQHRDATAIVVGHRLSGTGALWRGEPAMAREHLEQALALYDPARHRSLAFLYVQDPRVAALSGLSWALVALGYPEQARARSREALGAARELAHVHTLAYALMFASFRAQLCRESDTRELAEALVALATEQKFPHFLGAATVIRGWALTEAGEADAGLAPLREGLAAWRASGAGLYEPYFLGLQAEAHCRAGRAREGLELLAEALARTEQSNEGWFEAELHRLKGEALVSLSGQKQPAAESCFRHAVEIARRQKAKWWELRAATSLARLRCKSGKHGEARGFLAPVYGGLTEGFDTPDLKEAKAVLGAIE
jgi:predicted ATPase